MTAVPDDTTTEAKAAAWDTSPTSLNELSSDEAREQWREAYIERMLETKAERERADALAARLEAAEKALKPLAEIVSRDEKDNPPGHRRSVLYAPRQLFTDARAALASLPGEQPG